MKRIYFTTCIILSMLTLTLLTPKLAAAEPEAIKLQITQWDCGAQTYTLTGGPQTITNEESFVVFYQGIYYLDELEYAGYIDNGQGRIHLWVGNMGDEHDGLASVNHLRLGGYDVYYNPVLRKSYSCFTPQTEKIFLPIIQGIDR